MLIAIRCNDILRPSLTAGMRRMHWMSPIVAQRPRQQPEELRSRALASTGDWLANPIAAGGVHGGILICCWRGVVLFAVNRPFGSRLDWRGAGLLLAGITAVVRGAFGFISDVDGFPSELACDF